MDAMGSDVWLSYNLSADPAVNAEIFTTMSITDSARPLYTEWRRSA